MKKIILLVLLFSASITTAQSKVYQEQEVESQPMFPGGWNEYIFFVEKNFKWVPNEKQPKFISVEFTVEANGTITNVKVLNPTGSLNEKEALRVMALSPKWVPATLHGKAVACHIKYWMAGNPWADEEGGISGLTVEASNPKATTTTTTPDDDNLIYNTAGIEVQPNFPGGLEKFYQSFNNNFQMPDEEGLKGKIFVSFVVEKDGTLSQTKIIRDIGYGTGRETLRVLKLSPKWNPGKQNGKIVRVAYSMFFSIVDIKTEPVKK